MCSRWELQDGVRAVKPKAQLLPILEDAARWSDVVVLSAGVHFQLHRYHEPSFDAWVADAIAGCSPGGAVERGGARCLLLDTAPQHFPNTTDGVYQSCRPLAQNRTATEERELRDCKLRHSQPGQGPHCARAADQAASLKLFSRSRAVATRANLTVAHMLDELLLLDTLHIELRAPSSDELKGAHAIPLDCTHYCPNAEQVWDVHEGALLGALLELERDGRTKRHQEHTTLACTPGLPWRPHKNIEH